MATQITLDDLIGALAGSVIEAQDRIDQHQIAKIGQYFDQESNRPKMVNIKLPDVSHEAGEYDELDISLPLLSLVGNNFLDIKEMEVEFEVDLTNLGATEATKKPVRTSSFTPAGDWHEMNKADAIGVDFDSASQNKMARLSVKVEAKEPTEGMSRLMQLLNKLI
ncbi:DUF2589 domain-containing protein [Aliikangiella sp. G2MR2-5]|uniref:DUF2589 domain-containing protein n=1 Tax=Aliikangiella sp. G2MR2-5 TaxID=2788943 RepID=UPI0018AB1335|nr:DUF2589 domain-containing protein [Aliikangiella sp. G2MR2-5]